MAAASRAQRPERRLPNAVTPRTPNREGPVKVAVVSAEPEATVARRDAPVRAGVTA
jgi:hypothetical protein